MKKLLWPQFKFKFSILTFCLVWIFSGNGLLLAQPRTVPKNVIIFHGDGMGFEQVKAGGVFVHGDFGRLSFESWPNHTQMTTYDVDGSTTDSAASATAMATGVKVKNGVLSWDTATGTPIKTILEHYKDRGKSTGLVTTFDSLDASPAAYGAHEPSRGNYSNIFLDYINDSKPNVVFGAYDSGRGYDPANAAEYTIVTDRSGLNSSNLNSHSYFWGHFRNNVYLEWEFKRPTNAPNQPSLAEMTTAALDVLENNPQGFFLFVENEHIDEIGHRSNYGYSVWERTMRLVYEVKALDDAVKAGLAWAEGRDDTLIIVLSDHETGRLKVNSTARGASNIPSDVSWAVSPDPGTGAHTDVPVPVYAWGAGAERINLIFNNSDIPKLAFPQVAPSFLVQPQSQTFNENETLTFQVDVDGTEIISYQWSKNGIPIPGATSRIYTTPALTRADDGTSYSCVATNSLGQATSNAAVVAISSAPRFTLHPVSQAVNENETATFQIEVSGTEPISLQWIRNGIKIPGASGSSYKTPILTRLDDQASFQCIATNVTGQVASNVATVTVNSSNSIGMISLPPGEFKLQGGPEGYLNPSKNEVATLFFTAAGPGKVTWDIYDRMGQKVHSLSKDTLGQASDHLEWNGTNEGGSRVASGLYVFRLVAPGIKKTGKLVVIN